MLDRSTLTLCLALCAACASLVAAETAEEQLQALTDEAWEYELRENPLFATETGDSRYDDQLGRFRPEDYQRRMEKRREFLARAKQIDSAALPATRQDDLAIFLRQLENDIAETELQAHLTPITNRWGFHIEFAQLPRDTKFKSARDYRNYVARLQAFGQYADDHIALMREGIERGEVLPAVVLEGFQQSIDAHITNDPTKSRFYEPLRKFPDGAVTAQERKALRAAAVLAIGKTVTPAYRRFAEFMSQEYLPACRGTVGASALPNGRAFYRHRVRKYTTVDITPDEVHALGLAEVKRIRAEMMEVIKEVEFDGDFDAFVARLRKDERFHPESPEHLLKEVAYVLKRMDGKLPELFKRLPRTPYGIREVPAYIAPRTTTAYYQLPAGDGSRAGFYYVNTYNLKSRPLYEIEALSLHEAVPGHHLQLALQQELDLPKFRRFAGFTAFVEGWALYAERLGLEVGFYDDPYSNFGRLSYEMWRACRLVVDTGLHYKGWTRKQAIDFLAANTALSLHNIEAEVDRYISWPGQALAYKMGELKIRELRAFAEQQLGARFDIREFHDVVLRGGAVPLDILEKNVKRWVAQSKAAD